MPNIYVDFSGLKQIGFTFHTVSISTTEIMSDLKKTVSRLDWDIKYESDIAGKAEKISQKLEKYSEDLKSYQNFIDDAYQEYAKLNDWRNNSPSSYFAPLTDAQKKFSSLITSVFDAYDKWGENKAAGFASGIFSGFINLYKFCFGDDKEKAFGAAAYCDMADSSVKAWSKLYDDYKEKQKKGQKTGLFGTSAQRTVKGLGIAGSLAAFIGSVVSVSSGSDKKKWQETAGDYIDTGDDLLSVIQSVYEAGHVGDKNSLSESKVGSLSALDVYKAIGEAVVKAVSQGFKSAGKYFEDGQWSTADTGAECIDIATAGIYGIAHSLTLGLDDAVYGIVARLTSGGKEVSSDLNYFEQAAEGYKILGEKIGKWLANSINR